MTKIQRSDNGGMTIKGVITILIILLVIYILVSFFPLVQVPFSLDGEVREMANSWLKTDPKLRRPADLKRFKDRLNSAIEDNLRSGHEYEIDDLVFQATLRSEKVKIYLPYTILIKIFGMEYRYEKVLDIEERAWHF